MNAKPQVSLTQRNLAQRTDEAVEAVRRTLRFLRCRVLDSEVIGDGGKGPSCLKLIGATSAERHHRIRSEAIRRHWTSCVTVVPSAKRFVPHVDAQEVTIGVVCFFGDAPGCMTELREFILNQMPDGRLQLGDGGVVDQPTAIRPFPSVFGEPAAPAFATLPLGDSSWQD